MISVVRLPKILKGIRKQEAFTNLCFTEQTNAVNKLSFNFEAHTSQLLNTLSTKADAHEVTSLLSTKADANEVISLLSTKAETQIVEELRGQLSTKADAHEVISLLSTKAETQIVEELRGQLSTKADAQNVKKQIQSLNEELITILSQIRDHKLNILDQQRRLSMLLEEAQKRPLEAISASGNQAEIMLKEKEHIFDALYVAFENRFRGTRDDIKNRLKVYLPYIEKVLSTIGNGTVLDIGCGEENGLSCWQKEVLLLKAWI